MATYARDYLTSELSAEVDFIDTRTMTLPDFDDEAVYRSNDVADLTARLGRADAIVLATPIYNYSTSAALKKVIELTGTDDTGRPLRAWEDKVVTFLCSAGIQQSYLAYLAVANSLMLDFKCVINPYAAVAVEDDFAADGSMSNTVIERIERSLTVSSELATSLSTRTYKSTWWI